VGITALVLSGAALPAEDAARKESGVFYPNRLIQTARSNAEKYPWAAENRDAIVKAAQPWTQISDEDLWSLMFGNTISRSWMVWSNGYCPACKKGVPMYNWRMDPFNHPWKTQCPHCNEFFPKNDFGKFYRSGLDEHNVFDPARADRSLLFNEEHPDANDPLRGFGVDDGEGYVDGDKRWRFIGAYLIYGQFKRAIVDGIRAMADAYSVTGEKIYAHKAGILLDRVADLYPSFDFGKEGLVYEVRGAAGYVSTWHDACYETRLMVIAYDQIFEAIRGDAELVSFLAGKSERFKLDNPKKTFGDIQRNIEDRILRDCVTSRKKIESNYPQTDTTIAFAKTVLGWPSNREEVMKILDGVLERATRVDGVTGEKGLAGYTAYAVNGTAWLLAQYAQMDPTFLPEILKRHPRIHQMFRFHLDTLCLDKYYPTCGDSGSYARPFSGYCGVSLSKNPGMSPSMHTFLGSLCDITGDAGFAQILYRANGNSSKDMPYDLFAEDPEAFQKRIEAVIAKEGTEPRLASVNKQEWRLAILRAGEGADRRALWLDYDSGGAHSHHDGMNLGLFAKGLDLMPDFGYPPVNYGGWGAPKAVWYTMTSAHCTVVFDGENQDSAQGRTTLWADCGMLKAIRASCPELADGGVYERSAIMINVSPVDFYVVDVFRVVGGKEHAKFAHSHFGDVAVAGLKLESAPDFGRKTEMRSFRTDPSPQPGWSVEWKVEDRLKLLPQQRDLRVRHTDFTRGACASLCEGWVSINSFVENEDAWIPRIMVGRKSGNVPLDTTFVSVIDPYEGKPFISKARRMEPTDRAGNKSPDSVVALEISHADGVADLVVESGGKGCVVKEWGLVLDGDVCAVRRAANGQTERIALAGSKSLEAAGVSMMLKDGAGAVEVEFEDADWRLVSGDAQDVLTIRIQPVK